MLSGWKIRQALVAAIVLLGAGCVGVVETAYEGPASSSEPVTLQPITGNDYFAYKPQPFSPEWQSVSPSEDDAYEKFTLIFPPSIPDAPILNPIEATYYQSKNPAEKPLIIILPIWGSYTYPTERLSKLIRKKTRGGVNLLQINGEEPLFNWPRMRAAASEEEFRQLSHDYYEKTRSVVVGMRRMVDWADSESDLDPERVAIVGFSMGAIVTAMALGREPRFRTGVMVMGAGKPGEVFATCDGKPGDVRDTIMKRFDWSIDQYQSVFDDLFKPGDPEKYKGRYRPEDLLIIEASLDNCMSRPAREALWDATGQPARIKLLARHKMAFLSMTPLGLNFSTKKMYSFLEDQLGLAEIPEN